jgi:hypothetical protein
LGANLRASSGRLIDERQRAPKAEPPGNDVRYTRQRRTIAAAARSGIAADGAAAAQT